MLAAHGLDATSTVVDLGAGTGRFALAAARRFGRVTAEVLTAEFRGSVYGAYTCRKR